MNSPPLSIQLTLPERFRENHGFLDTLSTLGELGFHGVELNIADPLAADFADISHLLGSYGLALTAFASGLSARERGLSLSHYDSAVRERTIDWCVDVFDRLPGDGIGFIAGYIKGAPAADPGRAINDFSGSLVRLASAADRRGVHLLIEATNRYESSVANSLDDAAALISGYDSAAVSILPDTFHMNIEETDMNSALAEHAGRYRSLHLSDNNRRFPGFGSIDFGRVFDTLGRTAYTGGIVIEGNAGKDLSADVKFSAAYLRSVR